MVRRYPRLVVLTGAGLSARSGIPTYRDDSGTWLRSEPILHQEFIGEQSARQRYWARSLAGWPYVHAAQPNCSHRALVELESSGHIPLVVTQNVDRLHQRAGHLRVVDLHGRLDQVLCLHCDQLLTRDKMQQHLLELNPEFKDFDAEQQADGDAAVEAAHVAAFRVPDCANCGGVLMPDVVFFGGTVPKTRVERVNCEISAADALLVLGSSLAVYSGFRFCRFAKELNKPLLIVNRGTTRADSIADLKVSQDCGDILSALVERIENGKVGTVSS